MAGAWSKSASTLAAIVATVVLPLDFAVVHPSSVAKKAATPQGELRALVHATVVHNTIDVSRRLDWPGFSCRTLTAGLRTDHLSGSPQCPACT